MTTNTNPGWITDLHAKWAAEDVTECCGQDHQQRYSRCCACGRRVGWDGHPYDCCDATGAAR